jgi:hypothetical protein
MKLAQDQKKTPLALTTLRSIRRLGKAVEIRVYGNEC